MTFLKNMDPLKKTALQGFGVVIFMGALAWASVPLYDWFCRVTGFGGTTNVAEAGSVEIVDRTIEVRFDASLERDMPWEFKPLQLDITLRLGEEGLIFYEAYNPTDQPVAGTASFNVAPYGAGLYFSKIACFCFEEQLLMPGERVEMPVSFFVDPDILNDTDAKHAKHITLSYTFHQIELSEEMQALVEMNASSQTQTN
jgi:cytochrome c oxidase assembly protein subunit 11